MDRVGQTALENAIRERYGCDPAFVDSAHVAIATFENSERKIIWQGPVHMFDLIGHHEAKRAYAWSELDENAERKIVAVLQVGPVRDAASAVRWSLNQEE